MIETVTKVNGIPLDLLIEIARIIDGNPKLLEDRANGYAVGYEKGYKDAIKAFHDAMEEAVNKPPSMLYKNENFSIHGFQFNIEPKMQPKLFDDELMYRLHRDVEVIPQEIVVAIKTKGEKDEEE